MRNHKECMADNFCSVHNGRICIPVKKEYKLKISGSVIDKSSTGSTLFMEPTIAAKYYEELQLLRISEENEVYRILYTLSAMVADEAENIGANLELLEKPDFIFSKGKLSLDSVMIFPLFLRAWRTGRISIEFRNNLIPYDKTTLYFN